MRVHLPLLSCNIPPQACAFSYGISVKADSETEIQTLTHFLELKIAFCVLQLLFKRNRTVLID